MAQTLTPPVRFSAVDLDRFDRQKRIAGWNQDALAQSRVLVAGAGALGNEVVKLLLQLGVRDITLADFDTVSNANLNRCVFFEQSDADNARLKAEVVAERASRLYPDARVKPVISKIEELPDSAYDINAYAFGCLDNLGARLHLNANAYGRSVFVDGGTTGFFGKVQLVASPSACFECGLSKKDYEILWRRYSCVGDLLDVVDPKMPALPTTTSLVAALQVQEFAKHALQLPGDSLVGKFAFIDGLRADYHVFDVPHRSDCPVHST